MAWITFWMESMPNPGRRLQPRGQVENCFAETGGFSFATQLYMIAIFASHSRTIRDNTMPSEPRALRCLDSRSLDGDIKPA